MKPENELNGPINRFTVDSLGVEVYPDRQSMGDSAAAIVAGKLKELISNGRNVRMIFAAAPSQNELLAGLCSAPGIDWSKVTAFHMDEYVWIQEGAEQSFGTFLKTRIFGKVVFKEVHYINPNPSSLAAECERYSALLSEAPIDIVCLGIGENGHIAFNDPGVADFEDPLKLKVVDLDEKSRQQQVNDGCFGTLAEVPAKAITLTIPALTSADFMCTVVPGPTKADAIRNTIEGEIGDHCPATVLRKHPNAVLFLDADSASRLS